MKAVVWSVGLVFLLAACAPAVPSPAPAQPKAAASPAAKVPARAGETKPAAPKPAASPAAKPAPKAEPKAPAPWEQAWERTLAAARQEGKVAVSGPEGVEARDALTEPFTRKYGIVVDFLGGSAPQRIPRVIAERGAGQYLWDVFIGGTTPTTLVHIGAFEPLEPALILPEVNDPSLWRGGGPEFVDEGRQLLVMTPFQRGTIFVNTSLARPEEIRSYKDLLDPKWKGQIAMDDPRIAGPGQATFTFIYLHPELGPDFIRALAAQEPIVLRDRQQEVDALGQGRYPLLVGAGDFFVEARMKQGAPVAIVDPRQLREGSDVSPANGATALFNNAPHPNAARIYLNWLLSKEGQTEFVRATGYVSARADAPTDHAAPWRVPQPGAIPSYTAEAIKVKDEQLVPLLKEVFGD